MMAQMSYETPLDANFVSAYEMYNQHIYDFDNTHTRTRRNPNTDDDEIEPDLNQVEQNQMSQANDIAYSSAPPIPAPRNVVRKCQTREHGDKTEEASKGKSIMRYLVNSLLIGYTAVVLYCMTTDGQPRRGTR